MHLNELVINIEGSSAKKGFCVGAWGLPVEHVFLLNPNKFPKDMTWERLILLCLRKKRPKNSRHTLVQVWLKGVPATGDWEGAPYLQQNFESYFFLGHPLQYFQISGEVKELFYHFHFPSMVNDVRQHCRLTICIELVELTNSVSDDKIQITILTETRCLVYKTAYLGLLMNIF